MGSVHELIPFAKEMLSQKPTRKMVKIYLLGSVLAFFGVVIGLVETVVSPFASAGQDEEEEEERAPAARVPQTLEAIVLKKSPSTLAVGARIQATRGHAS
ncbi:G0/G1 switch protein 2 [Ambystoma mexicanum]|uniref:G0/G1 switch protein 2 n=1 Tax=Ambystoma mexicanum TaxID=8296 RepID=UPI0037E9C982